MWKNGEFHEMNLHTETTFQILSQILKSPFVGICMYRVVGSIVSKPETSTGFRFMLTVA